MRGVYNIVTSLTGKTGAGGNGHLLQITTATNEPVEILSAIFSLPSPTAGEVLDIAMTRMGATPHTTGDSPVTPESTEDGEASAFGGQVDIPTVVNTDMTVGTEGNDVYRDALPVETGWRYKPIPEERIHVQGGNAILFDLQNTITASDIVICVTMREIG